MSITKKTVVACLAASVAMLVSVFARAEGTELQGIVLSNDRTVDATSNQSIAKGIWHDGMNEQQKAYAMWRFFILRNMHRDCAPVIEDGGCAAEVFTKTGYGICGNWAGFFSGCLADNGMTVGRVMLGGHWVNAVQYWGAWHTFDSDMWNIYANADGLPLAPWDIKGLKKPAPGVAPVKSFPWYIGSNDSILVAQSCYNNANLSGAEAPQAKRNWVYNLKLRPGQEMVWTWYGDPDVGFVCVSHLPTELTKKRFNSLREYLESDFDYYKQNTGKAKWNWGYRRGGITGAGQPDWAGLGGNGRLTMDLGADGFKNALAMASASDNVEVKDGKLALKDATKEGSLTLDFSLPYAYGDAWVEKPLPEKGLKIFLNNNQVYPGGAGVDDGQRIRLFDLVRCKSGFTIKAVLEAGAAPLEHFKAIGAFHLNYTVLPAAVKGKNNISIRLADPKLLANCPLHVTYVYDQVDGDKKIMRMEKVLNFTPDTLTQTLDTGDKHWPLMREIHMRCGGPAPQAARPAEEKGELDWASAPWEWAYNGVNFWCDFERGDRQGWHGQLTTKNTFNGSDFALDNSLLLPDGTRELKIQRGGAFLNRDSKLRCQIWVKNVAKINYYTKNTGPDKNNYYGKEYTGFKDGAWQTFEVRMNDLANSKGEKVQDNWYIANAAMRAFPAEGKTEKDVEFLMDSAVCYDGELKIDPCTDPDAVQKSLADDPIWNARKPESAK